MLGLGFQIQVGFSSACQWTFPSSPFPSLRGEVRIVKKGGAFQETSSETGPGLASDNFTFLHVLGTTERSGASSDLGHLLVTPPKKLPATVSRAQTHAQLGGFRLVHPASHVGASGLLVRISRTLALQIGWTEHKTRSLGSSDWRLP